MEASFAAAVLMHPIALLVLGLAVFGAVHLGAGSGHPHRHLSRLRLLWGFCAVAIAAVGMAAVDSYVPPSEAFRFGVGSENYWGALWRQFAVLVVLVTYIALLGCAAVGVPIIVQLAKRGMATVPIVVVVSIPISLAVLVPLGLASSTGYSRLARDLVWLAGSHAVMAFAFAVGARLPWCRAGRPR
jgi:hypothetical protein